MNKSSEIGELAAALSKLQGEVKDAYKNRSGYNFDYADLSSVLEIARPLLAKNELAVTQLPSTDGNGNVIVETVLMHSSGQYIASQIRMEAPILNKLTPAQSTGVVITYARRYALSAALGITQTDTDAALIGDDAGEAILAAIEDASTHEALTKVWGELDGKHKRTFEKKFKERMAELKSAKQ